MPQLQPRVHLLQPKILRLQFLDQMPVLVLIGLQLVPPFVERGRADALLLAYRLDGLGAFEAAVHYMACLRLSLDLLFPILVSV